MCHGKVQYWCSSRNGFSSFFVHFLFFVHWCEINLLWLNASKTKENVFDFSKHPQEVAPVNIRGPEIEDVKTYKYLVVYLNNKLDWSENTIQIYKKGQSRIHLFR